MITKKMYLRTLTICILLSSSFGELISVRQKVRTLGERLDLLERKQMLESYAGGNDGETTTTDRLEQDIQAKVNATEQRLERSIEVFKHTANNEMQAVLRGIKKAKVMRKRSAERVTNQLESHIRKLVTMMTDRFDKQDADNLELMKQVSIVSDRIETVHKNLKDDMTDTMRHYGNQCVLDNAVVLKTIEDTVNASQCHTNANEEAVKTTDDSLTNPTEKLEPETCTTCPSDWTLFHSTNSCYKLFSTGVTFDGAVQSCIDVNSRITDITSDLENEFVVSFTPGVRKWIGLTDEETEGDWRLKHNNHAASYAKWATGQPSGATGQNCAFIDWEKRWYDIECSETVEYICKMVLPQTCVLDNAVVLKTIEDTVDASQCHTNANEEAVKTTVTDDLLTNPTETREPETCTTCPSDWTLFPSTNSCYKLFSTGVTFDGAVQSCIDVNSRITDITSDSENDFVVSFKPGVRKWIGLTDEETEGDWRLEHNNHAASYAKWATGQPNGATGQNCAFVDWEKRWYDIECSETVQYICKMVLPQTC